MRTMRDRHHRLLGVSLLIAFASFLLAACSAGPGSGGVIEGTEWILRSYADGDTLAIVPETQYADAEFDRSRVVGLSGCNNYNAVYRQGGRTLLISQPALTLMACDEESMAFEQTYITNLQASRFYSVKRETLTIFGAKGATLLVFDAAPRNPLLGTWNVDSYADGSSVVAAPKEPALEVVFGLASVGGFSGCNTFSGTYGTNGNYVRISRLATTQKACDEEATAVETAFLKAIEGTAFLDRRGDAMLLTDRSGSMLVALVRPQPEAAASPSPSAEPSAEVTPAGTAAPKPTETPAPTKTPAPTTAPTEAPSATPAPTPAPSVPPIIVPDGLDLRPAGDRRHGARDDLLPGGMVDAVGARGPSLPLFRPRPDHGPERSGDPQDRDHGRDVLGRLCRCRRGGEGRRPPGRSARRSTSRSTGCPRRWSKARRRP